MLEKLARADAFRSMGLGRREALWAIRALGDKPLPLFEAAGEAEQGEEPTVVLPEMAIGEEVVEDYSSLRLTLRRHPLDLLRPELPGAVQAASLLEVANGARISVAGLVLARQRPGTAKGVIFVTLEDETGTANIIVWPKTFERFRRIVLSARLMRVTGKLQREGIVTHLIADRLEDLSPLLDTLSEAPRAPTSVSNPPAPRHPRDQAKVLFPSRDFH